VSTPQLTTTFLRATRPPTADVPPRRRSTCAAPVAPPVGGVARYPPRAPVAAARFTARVHPCRAPESAACQRCRTSPTPRACQHSPFRLAAGPPVLRAPQCRLSAQRFAAPQVHPCCFRPCTHPTGPSVLPVGRAVRLLVSRLSVLSVGRAACPLAPLARRVVYPLAHSLVLPRPSKGVIGLPIRFAPRSTLARDAGVSIDAARSSGERAVLRGHAPRNPPPPTAGVPPISSLSARYDKTAGRPRPRSTQNGPRRPGGRRGPRWWRRQAFSVG